MATGAAAQVLDDPQVARGVLRQNQIAAQRASRNDIRKQPLLNASLGAIPAEESSLDAANTSGYAPENVERAERNLPAEQQFASQERRRITQATRSDILQIPAAGETEEEADIADFEAQEQAIRLQSQSSDVSRLPALRNQLKQVTDKAAEKAGEKAKEEGAKYVARWVAKLAGHGLNLADAPGEDGWITFFLSYAYDLLRGGVSILVPEDEDYQENKYANYESRKDFVKNKIAKSAAKKFIHVVLPPYRPLREPGDFAYFLFEAILATLALTLLIAVFAMIVLAAQGIYAFFPSWTSLTT